jgi:hypothetical protein
VLDCLAALCTVVNGSILIVPDLNSSFYLTNIRNITGDFESYSWQTLSTQVSIDLPDLESVGTNIEVSSRIKDGGGRCGDRV